MSKARVTWAFQEVVASSKLNEANTDWITDGLPIISADGAISDEQYDGGAAAVASVTANGVGLGTYVFNPAKSVYDRMHILWGTCARGATTAVAPTVEYTLNQGAAWIAAPVTFAFPAIAGFGTNCFAGTVAAVGASGWSVIDISGVAATQWLAVRLNGGSASHAGAAAVSCSIGWVVDVFLANSVDTPL